MTILGYRSVQKPPSLQLMDSYIKRSDVAERCCCDVTRKNKEYFSLRNSVTFKNAGLPRELAFPFYVQKKETEKPQPRVLKLQGRFSEDKVKGNNFYFFPSAAEVHADDF